MNNVQLMGRLTKDVDLRTTGNGKAVGRFTVAVNRQFKNQNGEREADFINCIAFQKTAETIAKYFVKGSMIAIDGRIQTGSYENQQGQKVYTTDVVVNNFYFTESANNRTNQQGQGNTNNFNGQYGSNTGGFNSNAQPFQNPFEIGQDDLPF